MLNKNKIKNTNIQIILKAKHLNMNQNNINNSNVNNNIIEIIKQQRAPRILIPIQDYNRLVSLNIMVTDSLNAQNQRHFIKCIINLENQVFHKLVSKMVPKGIPIEEIKEQWNTRFKPLIKAYIETKVRKYLFLTDETCAVVGIKLKELMELHYNWLMKAHEIEISETDSLFDYQLLT